MVLPSLPDLGQNRILNPLLTYQDAATSTYETSNYLVPEYYAHSVFVAQWQSQAAQPPESMIGVGYISSPWSSRSEAELEALYLSRLLGGIPVTGVHNKDRQLPLVGKQRIGQATIALLQIWKNFCQKYPQAKFLQYFYGTASYAVASALLQSCHNASIIIIGINSDYCLPHSLSYYYRYEGDPFSYFARQNTVTLPRHPLSEGRFLVSFQDPAFVTAIQFPYYKQIGLRLEESEEHFLSISRSVMRVLNIHTPLREVKAFELLKIGGESLFSQAQKLQHGLKYALLERERWTQDRMEALFHMFTSALRLVDYTANRIATSKGHILELLMHSDMSKEFNVSSDASFEAANAVYKQLQEIQNIRKQISLYDEYPSYIFPCNVRMNTKHRNVSFGHNGVLHRWINCTGNFSYPKFIEGNCTYQTSGEVAAPCNISSVGVFVDGSSPYGVINKSTEFYINFFSGNLLQEHLRTNHSQYIAKGIIQNVSLVEIYPGNIKPDGEFINHTLKYPYGVFPNHSFPYKLFFMGGFDYEKNFTHHLDIKENTSHNRTESVVSQNTSFSVTYPTYLESSFESSSDSLLLPLYWGLYGISQLTLVLFSTERYRTIRAVALSISSVGFVMNVVDLVSNLDVLLTRDHIFVDNSVRSVLCMYSCFFLIQETIRYAVPWVRERGYRFSRQIRNFPSGTIRKVDKTFRSAFCRIRAYLVLFTMFLVGGFFLMRRLSHESFSLGYEASHIICLTVAFPIIATLVLTE